MKAFCPFHITGFFGIRGNEKTASSIGCGIVIAEGATTEAVEGSGSVFINGVRSAAPTTATVMTSLADNKADIRTDVPIPISCGFGTSGAGALGAALALSGLRSSSLSFNALCGIAQRAEIVNKTGVGDVVAQAIGGVVIRRLESVDRIPMPPRTLSFVIFGQLSTAQVIADREMMRGINTCGSRALKRLDKKPTFDEFMSLSKEFAYETGLLGGKARDAVEAVEAAGGSASMAMLGDAVFAIDPGNALSEFGDARRTRIYNCGAHLIG